MERQHIWNEHISGWITLDERQQPITKQMGKK